MGTRLLYEDNPDAIITAAFENDRHAVWYLIKKGCDVNARDEQGNTGVICAADNGSVHIIRLLCRYGADINIPNSDGDRAIDIAKYRRNDAVVPFLRSKKAIEKEGPSAIEQQWDEIYSGFESADAVRRLAMLIEEKKKDPPK